MKLTQIEQEFLAAAQEGGGLLSDTLNANGYTMLEGYAAIAHLMSCTLEQMANDSIGRPELRKELDEIVNVTIHMIMEAQRTPRCSPSDGVH